MSKEFICGKCRILLRTAINQNYDMKIVDCDACGQRMKITWNERGELHIREIARILNSEGTPTAKGGK